MRLVHSTLQLGYFGSDSDLSRSPPKCSPHPLPPRAPGWITCWVRSESGGSRNSPRNAAVVVFHTWRRSGYMPPRHGELTFQSCLSVASHLCGLFTSFFQTNGSTTSRLWASVTRNVCEHSEMTCGADGTRRKNAGERSLIPVAAASWRSLVPVLRALCDAARNACTSLAQYLNLNAQGVTLREGAA